jgi:hypothetical protein
VVRIPSSEESGPGTFFQAMEENLKEESPPSSLTIKPEDCVGRRSCVGSMAAKGTSISLEYNQGFDREVNRSISCRTEGANPDN